MEFGYHSIMSVENFYYPEGRDFIDGHDVEGF
jgi:hypothetical protein